MNIQDLKYFFAVVTEGNFTKASAQLRVAQPAISRAVMRLELDLGGDLLIRHKRHVELTALGNAVTRYAKNVFENVKLIEALSQNSAEVIEGPLSIAAGDTIATHLLPRALASLAQEHTGVLPLISVGPSGPLLERIGAGEIDLGVFFYVPNVSHLDLETSTLCEIPYRFVIHKKESKNREVLTSFIGSREIDSPSNTTYPTLDKLRKKHPGAKIRFSSNNLGMHKELVLLGMGVSVLPEFLVSQELKKKTLTDVLPGEKFLFTLKLVRHRIRPLKPAAKKFLEVLSKSLR